MAQNFSSGEGNGSYFGRSLGPEDRLEGFFFFGDKDDRGELLNCAILGGETLATSKLF
jgi:hypothetical protein